MIAALSTDRAGRRASARRLTTIADALATASSGVTQELIASTPELGGDPEQEYFGGRQARRCAARGA